MVPPVVVEVVDSTWDSVPSLLSLIVKEDLVVCFEKAEVDPLIA